MNLFIYNNMHNGDVLTNRCFIQRLLLSFDDIQIAVGSFRDRYYLVKDLPVRHIISKYYEGNKAANDLTGDMCLSHLCPKDFKAINMHCGYFPDISKDFHNWKTLINTFNCHMGNLGYPKRMSYNSQDVPLISFPYRNRFQLKLNAIFIENSKTRAPHSDYNFNMNEISNIFSKLNFYCSSEPECRNANVINCEKFNLVELSQISDRCEAIIGKGSGPFIATLTETNHYKPRAVMNFNAPKFWEYPGNTIQYLSGDEECYRFLHQLEQSSEWRQI